MNTQEMREKRHKLWVEMQSLTEAAHNANRNLDKDEDEKYNRMFADHKRYGDMIDIAVQEESRAAAEAAKEAAVDTRDAKTKELDEFRTAVQTLTTTAGGYTIPTFTQNDLEIAMKWYGPMLQVSKILNTANGGTLYMPTVNDTANVGYQIAVNTDSTTSAAAFTFGQKQLDAYDYTSGLIQIPNALFRDNVVNLQAYIVDALAERIGRGINLGATTGDGSGHPQGVVPASTKGSDAAATALTRDDILDLIYSVDPAYRANSIMMLNDTTLLAIMKLWDTYSGAIYKASPIAGEPPTIEGVKFVINNDMAAIAANAKSVVYGDFSKYVIRLVGGYRLLSSEHRFMEFDQTAFVAHWAWDGELLNGGTNPIKHILHAAS